MLQLFNYPYYTKSGGVDKRAFHLASGFKSVRTKSTMKILTLEAFAERGMRRPTKIAGSALGLTV